MSAGLRDMAWGIVVEAAPAGEYGFGTIGVANREQTLEEAWRMVQRAGLAKVADRSSGRLVTSDMGARCEVEYDLIDGTDVSRFKAKHCKN